MACVGLVAAQAGSMDFLRLQLAQLTKATDDKPLVVHTANGAHRSYSTASPERAPAGMFVRASQPSADAPAVGSAADEVGTSGDAMTDADLFALAHGATTASVAASPEPRQLDGRFHGALMSGGSPADRPDYGGGPSRRAKHGLADCCEGSATQADGSLLTQPVLADALSGPIPETATWGLMILGFGMSGVLLRGQRRRA